MFGPKEKELAEESTRGVLWSQLLDDNRMRQDLEKMERDILKKIAETKINQRDEREDLYLLLQGLKTFLRYAESFINRGEFAAGELDKIKKGVNTVNLCSSVNTLSG